MRTIKEIRIVGRVARKSDQMAEQLAGKLGIPAYSCLNFREAAAGAGIICATTHAADPVVIGEWLEPGTHVNSVGLNPLGGELDQATILKPTIFVESRQAALA